MGRLVIGGIAAGLVMFILGFVFYGSPLMAMLGLSFGDDAPPSSTTMIAGFIQLSVSAFVLGVLLWLVRDRISDMAGQMQVVIWSSITAMVFTYMGDPIWEGAGWAISIYAAVTGFIMLVVAGYVLARWFISANSAAA